MNIRILAVAIIALSFAAGAGVSNARSANTGVNTAAVPRPIQVVQLLSGPTWVYYKNRNRYRSLAYNHHINIFNKFTAVSFINTGSQPIQQVTFELAPTVMFIGRCWAPTAGRWSKIWWLSGRSRREPDKRWQMPM